MKLNLLLSSFALAASAGTVFSATSLITPTSVTAALASTPPSPGIAFFPVVNVINNTGLSGAATIANYTTITHAAASAANAWTTDDPAPAGGDWFGEGNAAVNLTLGLGGSFALSDFVYWGYHFNAANGNEARAFTISFSTDGGATFPTSTTVSTPLSDYAIGASKTLSLGGVFTANTVRVSITDNHFGGTAAGGDRLGLGEVKFIAVPEPSVGLLALLPLAGLALRRRR